MLRFLLVPASWVYGWVVRLRNYLFDAGLIRSEKFSVPIICVGNITVGGTGKTPMAEMIVDYMSRRHKVALLSRGYGRKTKGYIEVSPTSHYREVGDEPLQIKLKFPDTLVVVCEKRALAIHRIIDEHPDIDLIILDDGFQHRYVNPTVNVVMVDATRPLHEDNFLPYGTLRDDIGQLHRAHYFVVAKCPEDMTPIDRRIMHKNLVCVAYQKVYFTRIESFSPRPVFPDVAGDRSPQRGSRVIALSGIGNPLPFHSSLEKEFEVVERIVLEDHHVYRVRDVKLLASLVEQYPDAVIVTTQKDAVKFANRNRIPMEVQRKLYFRPINISFAEESETDLLSRLEEDISRKDNYDKV